MKVAKIQPVVSQQPDERRDRHLPIECAHLGQGLRHAEADEIDRLLCGRHGERGRMAPEGLTYVGSWIEANFDRCFQLMECDDVALLQEWVLNWSDLADFEIVPVMPSKETSALVNRVLDAEEHAAPKSERS